MGAGGGEQGAIDGRGFGAAAEDYARHRADFPELLFERLRSFGVGLRGQPVLDLGAGTGSLARGFARAGARVAALDVDRRVLLAVRAFDVAHNPELEARFPAQPLMVPHRLFAAIESKPRRSGAGPAALTGRSP